MELMRWIRMQWDRVLGLTAVIVGIVLLVVGWIDVSSTEFVAKQVPFLVSAGLGGVVAVMIGGTLWISADLRDEWRALDRIDEAIRRSQSSDDDLVDVPSLDDYELDSIDDDAHATASLTA